MSPDGHRVELELIKMTHRNDLASAWDTGAQAGLDWDKSYPGAIRDSNPYRTDSP